MNSHEGIVLLLLTPFVFMSGFVCTLKFNERFGEPQVSSGRLQYVTWKNGNVDNERSQFQSRTMWSLTMNCLNVASENKDCSVLWTDMYLLLWTNYNWTLFKPICTLTPVSVSQKCHCCDSTLALCYLIGVSKRQPSPNRKSNPEGIQSTLTSSVIILTQPFLLWLSVVILCGTG